MGNSPQHEITPDSSAVGESSRPIYDAAQRCSKRFEEYLWPADGTKGDHFLEMQELRGQFNEWAAYLGTFARPRASLDARLAPHPEIRNRILELLSMMQDNFNWGNDYTIHGYT